MHFSQAKEACNVLSINLHQGFKTESLREAGFVHYEPTAFGGKQEGDHQQLNLLFAGVKSLRSHFDSC